MFFQLLIRNFYNLTKISIFMLQNLLSFYNNSYLIIGKIKGS